ncbi:LysR family substrate-binding domain-containing protein [Streptomyces sp. M10(2022)]
MALTDAGRQLLTDAGPLLASVHAVRHRVTVAARGSRRIMVGFRAGIAVAPAVELFAARHPDVLVDVQRIEWDDQAPMLLDGRIDVGYVRLPMDEAGLRVTPLYTEPRVAVLPVGHRLAGRKQITEADLAGEPLVWHADTSTQPTRRPHPNAGYLVRGWTRRSSMSRPAGASRSWPVRRPCSTHIRTSATCLSGPGVRPGLPRGGGIAHLASGRRLLHRGPGGGRDHGRMWELRNVAACRRAVSKHG